MAVHLLGIRHHGPGSARSVRAALDELHPDVVLVEAPADAEHAFEWVGHAGLVPPVALLGHVADEPRRAVFIPFAGFSPEWQAISWARRGSVPVRAIDLPLATVLARRPPSGEPPSSERSPHQQDPVDPLAVLASAAGATDPERWWDDVVEHRGEGLAVFDAVAEAMAAVRAGAEPDRFEAWREAHMRRSIRRVITEFGSRADIAVVCGAWHVPALREGASTVAADATTLRGLPRARVAVGWVPWTHRRLAAQTGYRAGVRSPGWYHHVFQHPGRDGVARFVVDAARVLRADRRSASPDHLVAITRMADALAALRGRSGAGLDEVLDAAESVTGGRSLITDRLVVGDAVGSVPVEAPQTALARDLVTQQRRCRLRPSAQPRTLELDLRSDSGRRRSQLLHRLDALGLRWGTLIEGRRSTGTFRETWRLEWEPELSVRLVELAGYGSSVEAAAAARLVERVESAERLVDLASALERALHADLAEAVEPIVAELARRGAADPDVGQLIDAVGPLASALRYGDARATDATALRRVFDGLVARSLTGVGPACASLDDDAAAVMVERLTALQAALALVEHPARRREFPALLARLARGTVHGLVQGRSARLLHDGGSWSSDELGRRLRRALTPGTPAASGARFVEGLLAGSGTLLVHDAALRTTLDRWLSALAPDAFVETLPLLRRTFGGFEPTERRHLGTLLVGAAPPAPVDLGPGFDPARGDAALRTVRALLGLPVTVEEPSHD